MKNLFLLFTLAILCFSCSKDEDANNPRKGKIIAKAAEIPDLPLEVDNSVCGEEVLGCGYDITGNIYHLSSVRAKVIDIDKIKREEPHRVRVDYTYSYESPQTYAGATPSKLCEKLFQYSRAEYLNTFTNNALFGGTINSYLGSNFTYPQNYSIALSQSQNTTKYVYLANTLPETLQKSLTSEFLEDIGKKDYDAVIEKYGTHFLVNIRFGFRLQLLYRANILFDAPHIISKEEIMLGRINSIWDPKNKGLETLCEKYGVDIEITDELVIFRTIGGDPEKGTACYITPGKDTPSYSEDWINSIENNLTFIWGEINEPIYELLPEGEDRDGLKVAFDKYIESRTFKNS